jgi:hypothetical protein
MTPKEQAVEIILSYYNLGKHIYIPMSFAKQCALIAVNNIITSNPHSNPLNTEIYSTMKYWIEVKQEIKLL